MAGYLVFENGKNFKGQWLGGKARAGEVVFNTSHNGYEEIATDPSYYGQIMVMCAPQQGNYGVDRSFWESKNLWIEGFLSLDIQSSTGNRQWIERLEEHQIPCMDEIDTRELVLYLREAGTQVGAMVQADTLEQAKDVAGPLIEEFKKRDSDWAYHVSRKEAQVIQGCRGGGPKVAVVDVGCKENILRELIKRCREIHIFPSRVSPQEIEACNPDGVLLSNGPGDPDNVEVAVETVQSLIGRYPIFGICMGHQILSLALGAKTFRLKFGHRGANHPVKDSSSNQIYVTSQNHGYAVDMESLPSSVKVTHINLNDQTVSGIECAEKQCFSVQFHPESHPGPRDADSLFDRFIDRVGQ